MEIASPHRPTSQKESGLCSVCKTVRKIHIKGGTIHHHGSHTSRCPGSNKPPLQTFTDVHPADPIPETLGVVNVPRSEKEIEKSTCSSTPTASINATAANSAPISHPNLTGPTAKHVPKAARPAVGQLLNSIISKILTNPKSVEHWRELLCFAPIVLKQIPRGGRKHNLTSMFKNRVQTFSEDYEANISTLFSSNGQPHNAKRKKRSKDQILASLISSKLEDGNIRAAVRLLMSDEEPIAPDTESFGKLQEKHPTPPPDRVPTSQPKTCLPLQMSENDIKGKICSFPSGSSGGPDGLRPQVIAELTGCPEIGSRLLSTITGLVNLLLSGNCPEEVRSTLFGGTLIALRKKSGDLRPIAIGYYWRRLASKCAVTHALPKVLDHFAPLQVGVGCPSGCEAAVHSTRRFLAEMTEDEVIVKLDFSNAFNSLHRDSMLIELHKILPELSAYGELSYGTPSALKFAQYSVSSQMGSQQGDPLGPLLFCLPLHTIMKNLTSALTLGYLDDLTLGGAVSQVARDVGTIESGCKTLGLSLNAKKCEIISKGERGTCISNTIMDQFAYTKPQDATLLGAPLTTLDAFEASMNDRMANLQIALKRLPLISKQDALILLRCSLSHSKMLHLLRCTPCAGHPLLDRYDSIMREGLENIMNIKMSDSQWLQATLPIKDGGLGFRRVSVLATSAFLASAAGTRPLQSSMLKNRDLEMDAKEIDIINKWTASSNAPAPTTGPLHKQSTWDRPLIRKDLETLSESELGYYHQARLKAVSSEHASDWLNALPISSCGLRMDDETIRVVVGLRLGAKICEKHLCPCGEQVAEDGAHGLSCRLGPGRVARHASLNDTIHRALVRVGLPSIKEPPGLSTTNGKRPDGMTLVPWHAGRSLLWDATVSDTVATTYLPSTSLCAGAAAEAAAVRKNAKYAELTSTYTFIPVAFETLGPINQEALSFLKELGRRNAEITGDKREGNFLFQRLSATIQRFNAVAFRGTFSEPEPDES